MRKLCCVLFVLVALAIALPGFAQVKIVGANATLKQLEGSPTLVTVVLKGERKVEDPNLKVVEVLSNAVNVETGTGDVYTYLYDTVAEIRVQGEVVEKTEFRLPPSRALRADDQKIVERAAARAQELFDTATDNQEIKADSAVLIRLHGGSTAVQPLEYLTQLVESNDLQTQMSAAKRLYLAGEDVPENVIQLGLASGNRKVRIDAIELAGLLGLESATPQLVQALNDRSDDLAAPAALALARLGNREIIPRLLNMLTESSEEKGNAAVKALVMLGGDEVIEQMRMKLPESQLNGRFRIVTVLYKLGDPTGRKQLQETMENVTTLALEAAVLLAESEDEGAMSYLRRRIGERIDETEDALKLRARIASALKTGDDPSAIGVLQELLRSDMPGVKIAVTDQILELGHRNLLLIIQPTIENGDAGVALHACMAAISFAFPEYRQHLLALRQ